MTEKARGETTLMNETGDTPAELENQRRSRSRSDHESASDRKAVNRSKGVFFLVMVILIWVGSAVLIQTIFDSDDSQFQKPLFLTYFSTSFFTLYLIPLLWTASSLRWRSRA